MSQPIEATASTAYTEGLRALADWLDANPSVQQPLGERLLLPLHTNPAVEALASEYGLTVVYDDEGNASVELSFGPVVYRAYGYVDFKKHCERDNEERARAWARRKGLVIRPPEDGDVSAADLESANGERDGRAVA